MLLSLFKIRQWIIDSIPQGLRVGITAGIGLFLALIGLKNAGIVVASPGTIITLGDITQFSPVMACLGLLLILGLAYRGFKGAVLSAIVVVSGIGLVVGDIAFQGIYSVPPSLEPVVGKLDIMGALKPEMLVVIVAFMFVNLFDTTGTLIAVAIKRGLADDNGKMHNMDRAMITDGTASWAGALMGTPTVTSYVESASGVAAGGRTGLVAVTVGIFIPALRVPFCHWRPWCQPMPPPAP